MIDRLTKGHLVPGVQAFRTRTLTGNVHTRLHQLPFYGRQVVKSNKNLQVQVCLFAAILNITTSLDACSQPTTVMLRTEDMHACSLTAG